MTSTTFFLTMPFPRGAAKLATLTVEVNLPPVVDIKGSTRDWATLMAQALAKPGKTVRLAPNVDAGWRRARHYRYRLLAGYPKLNIEVKYMSARADISKDFAGIHSKMRLVEQRYSAESEDLHLTMIARGDADLYPSLLDLAETGLKAVKRHHSYFSKHALYDDGMFWYDSFS